MLDDNEQRLSLSALEGFFEEGSKTALNSFGLENFPARMATEVES